LSFLSDPVISSVAGSGRTIPILGFDDLLPGYRQSRCWCSSECSEENSDGEAEEDTKGGPNGTGKADCDGLAEGDPVGNAKRDPDGDPD
jgi:hypothetical protein